MPAREIRFVPITPDIAQNYQILVPKGGSLPLVMVLDSAVVLDMLCEPQEDFSTEEGGNLSNVVKLGNANNTEALQKEIALRLAFFVDIYKWQ
jgi:hypothetical protein